MAGACRCACSASMRWSLATLAPALMPRPARGADRLALFAPATVFLNPAAREQLGERHRCSCRPA